MAPNMMLLRVLAFLLLSSFSFALRGSSWQQNQCQINRITAHEPTQRVQSEGGYSEFWDFNKDEFQCAGVSFHRHTVQARGMMLPAYHNSPLLVYVVQGQGYYGIMISGCPETFESSQQSLGEGGGEKRFRDRHQRIGHFRKGDIIAVPAGAPHWFYNNADEELVVVVLQDNANSANQLDQNPRSFFLAGNPQGTQEKHQRYREEHGGSTRGQHEFGNVFQGLDVETLAEVFGVDQETARKLRSEDDSRGAIIRIEKGLHVIKPPFGEEEHEGRYGENGLEETMCSAKLRENIDNPARADVYNPRAGRFSTVNSLTLPILSFIRLSAARGVLHKHAIMAPHWYVNAHDIVYVTRGELRVQIVNHLGQAVFNDRLREGQVVVVPHNFAVVKQAGEEGAEWVSFNTNENAMINTLSGRTSALRGLPVAVIANAYQISEKEAEKLKFSRRETFLFSGSGRSYRGGRAESA
ncbi:legumin B-like [Dorcoceras hygrometricum]|uniref:Legumin B-like n=1 Tax=Dorcoceras hygrometricum TaxID=472368 RepID=A0A2Z7BG43_9LAMI|nr:legumin B-like [Dorcoceras hygrometricum]